MVCFLVLKSLTKAWKAACASTTPSKVWVPRSSYKLRQIELNGPCMAPIELQVDGNIVAPQNPSHLDGNNQWVKIGYIDFFTLSGAGTFDGQGAMAWKQNNCAKTWNCKKLSMVLSFSQIWN